MDELEHSFALRLLTKCFQPRSQMASVFALLHQLHQLAVTVDDVVFDLVRCDLGEEPMSNAHGTSGTYENSRNMHRGTSVL